MIGPFKYRFQQTWTTSDRPRPGRPRVLMRRQDRHIERSHFRNRFHLKTVTSRTSPGTHTSRVSAQTVRNRLQKICLRTRPPTV